MARQTTMADSSTTRLPLDPADHSSASDVRPPAARPSDARTMESPSKDSRPLEELRHLILAPEQEALERLNHRVANAEARTEDVSSVVAEAIQRRRQQGGDGALSDALAPTIESALRESVRKDPGTLADALFPVMGPAIRRSILETLRSFLDSFNQIMDQSLSWQGLKWRIEALRTGRPFTEVALLHSLVFRVEQVFLIHKQTGLSLGHAAAPSVAMQDPSLVSGMLSAIQDFVRDSFNDSKGQGIERMNVGDLDVWVESGPYAIVATVIRGVAPRALRDRMAEVLENIHREYSAQLDRFTGDTAPFAKVNQELARCLELQYKEETKREGLSYAWVAAGLLVVLFGGWFGWRAWQFHRWSGLVESLREQPGIVVTSLEQAHGRFVVHGLRDPLAEDPGHFIAAAGLNSAKAEFHWGAYYALDDAIVRQRAAQLLHPPKGVILNVQDGILQFAGPASLAWVRDVRTRALLIPGIRGIDLTGKFSPQNLAIAEAEQDIQSVIVKFPVASAALSAYEREALKDVAARVKDLLGASAELHTGSITLEIVGHSDSTGAEATNLTLSQRRAERVSTELAALGIPAANLKPDGVATTQPLRSEDTEDNRQYNRSVSFRFSAVTP